jgi:hypothetical protein
MYDTDDDDIYDIGLNGDLNVVPWFARSTDYWHLWYNMRDGASAPRTTNAVRDLIEYEYQNWLVSYPYPPEAVRPNDDNNW